MTTRPVTDAVLRQLRGDQKPYTAPLSLRIPEGEAGTLATLEAMSAVVDDAQRSPLVVQVAATIAASAPNRDYAAQLLALDQLCRDVFIFKPDSWGYEDIRHPDQLITEIRNNGRTACDCDDVSTFGASIIRALGRKPFFCACRRYVDGPFVHVHFGVSIANGQMIPLDPQERIPAGQWTCRPELRLIVPAART
jgi:hypothetical protein